MIPYIWMVYGLLIKQEPFEAETRGPCAMDQRLGIMLLATRWHVVVVLISKPGGLETPANWGGTMWLVGLLGLFFCVCFFLKILSASRWSVMILLGHNQDFILKHIVILTRWWKSSPSWGRFPPRKLGKMNFHFDEYFSGGLKQHTNHP